MQKESCETGNSVLQQLVLDERIVAYLPLHHAKKRQWLADHWAQSYWTRQPIEDIREYFGEEIALFFVWSASPACHACVLMTCLPLVCRVSEPMLPVFSALQA